MSRTTLFSIVRQKNFASILNVLHLEQVASRARISALTGISRSTVSNIINKLEKLQIVEYTNAYRDRSSVGRPGVSLRLNPKAFYAIGVEINVYTSRAMLVGLDGGVIAKQDIGLNGRADPDQLLATLAETAEQVISKSGTDRERIIGLGVSFMGLTDHTKGIVVRSTSLPAWNQINMVEGFQKRLALPTYVENNANAMTLGEARFGVGRGKDNILGVTIDEGLGGGIVINKRLYMGSHAAAGELGHMSIVPAGAICHCGNKGCLRTLASESAVEANAIRIIKTGVKTLLRDRPDVDQMNITVQDVIAAARRGDTCCKDIIVDAGRYLGTGLVNLVNVLSPELVVLSKDSLPTFELFFEEVKRTIAEGAYAGKLGIPDLAISALGEDAVCVGAASVVMDRLLARHEM
jgi:predicted NBD/HSP70 family sugar kinase